MKNRIRIYLKMIDLKREKNILEQSALFVRSVYKRIRDGVKKSNKPFISKVYLKSKSIERSLTGRKYKFVTIEDLVIWTNEFIKTLPISFDMIIGVPRSGLLVANIIALKLGKPVTTPDLYCKGVSWKSKLINDVKNKKVLLVDDTITSGNSIKEAKDMIMKCSDDVKVYTAAVIATEESRGCVDYYYKVMEHPRVFEWNMLHSKKGVLVSDMDGVICENCPNGIDENEDKYIIWINNTKPYLIPSFEIDVILSNRLEKYRKQTENWLQRNGVKYGRLVLWDIEDKNKRNGMHAENKVKALLKIKPDMIWESSLWEAKVIWEKTNIPTMCIDEMILLS